MKTVNKGFIKLPRTILEWQWYDDINSCKLMLHLLLKANFKRKQWRGQNILPNQLITSIEKLSVETGLSVSKVRTAIKNLKDTKDIITFSNNKFTKIQITSPFFLDMQNGKQTSNDQQTDDQQITTTNNDKELKRIIEEFKEEVFSHSQYSNKILNDFFNYWTEKNLQTGKMRFQSESFWEVEKRMAKWARNEKSQTNKSMLDIKR